MNLKYFAPLRQLHHLRTLVLKDLSCEDAALFSDMLVSLLPTLTTLTALRLDVKENDDGCAIAIDMCSLPTTLESLHACGPVALRSSYEHTLPRLTKLHTLTTHNFVSNKKTMCIPALKVSAFISVSVLLVLGFCCVVVCVSDFCCCVVVFGFHQCWYVFPFF